MLSILKVKDVHFIRILCSQSIISFHKNETNKIHWNFNLSKIFQLNLFAISFYRQKRIDV